MEWMHPAYPRITVNPEICFGKPRIKGTRMPVDSILAYLAGGMSVEELVAEFDWITRDDVLEAIAFAAATMDAYEPLEQSL